MIRFLIFKIRIRPAFKDYKSESSSSPRDLNHSPKRSGYLFYLGHLTFESQQISIVNKRRLPCSDRPVVTIIRSYIVSRGFDLVFLPCEQWSHIRKTIITPCTDADAMNFETWRTRPWQRHTRRYTHAHTHSHTTEGASKFTNK